MKTYETPEVEVIELHTEGVIAASSDFVPTLPDIEEEPA